MTLPCSGINICRTSARRTFVPKANLEFQKAKITHTQKRNALNILHLESIIWNVISV